MVERKEVEALLALVEAEKGRWSPHVPAPTLAVLCRAWLALDSAPVVFANKWVWESVPEHLEGTHVRIVKEGGDD